MVIRAFLATFMVLGFSFSAYARPDIAGVDAKDGGLPQSCRIQFFLPAGNLLTSCSGVLTAKNEVMTAGHCVNLIKTRTDLSVRVGCDSIGFGEFQETFELKSSKLHADYSSFETSNTKRDLGTIVLDRDAVLEPLEVVPARQLESFLKTKNLKCRTEGYGKDEAMLTGKLRNYELDRWSIDENFVYQETMVASGGGSKRQAIRDVYNLAQAPASRMAAMSVWFESGILRTSTLPGDSGGALLCRTKNTPWKVAAITLGAHLRIFEDDLIDSSQLYYRTLWTSIPSQGFESNP